MKITISGVAGSGKSTVAKAIARKLKLKHYSIGDLMRDLAKERGVTLLELSKQAESDESIDKALDDKQKDLDKEDNFVIDGRLTAFFIPNATIRVFLDCNDDVRAERILVDRREDESTSDIYQTIQHIKEREDSERKRYKQYYDVDYYDKSLYDIVIDTTELKVGEVIERILNLIDDPDMLPK